MRQFPMERVRASFIAVLSLGALVVAERLAAQDHGEETAAVELGKFVVTGRIASQDGDGIAGATVEWGADNESFERRQRVTTAADGSYRMPLKSLNGRNRVAASASGYLSEVNGLAIERGENERNFRLTKMPAAGNAIAGIVVDDRGQPIKDARVEAFTPVVGFHSSFSMPTGRDYFPGPDRVATTDARGRFRIDDLPDGEVQLSLRSKFRHVNDANYPVKDGVVVAMSGSGLPGVIQGCLVDGTTGLPILPVDDTRIVRRHSPTVYRNIGVDGRFVLPGEARLGATGVVYVFAKGYAAKEAKITAVPAGSTQFVDVILTARPPLRGKLIAAETGEPVAGAKVLYGVADKGSYILWSDLDRYTDGYHSFKFVQHEISNEAGEFWFAEADGAVRGTIITLVDCYERLVLTPEKRTLVAASGELVVRLNRESAFYGIVTENGRPVAGARIWVNTQSSDGRMQNYESVRADSQGRYKYGRLGPGQYWVSGGPFRRVATVDKGETVELNLSGELGLIHITGRASPSIAINLRPEFEWEYSNFSTTADATGRYEIRGLKPGRYRVSLHYPYAAGYISRENFVIDVDRDGQEIDLFQRPHGK